MTAADQPEQPPSQVEFEIRVPDGLEGGVYANILSMLQILNETMTQYEAAYGPITVPGDDEPMYPADLLIGQELGNTDDEVGDESDGDSDDPEPEEGEQ